MENIAVITPVRHIDNVMNRLECIGKVSYIPDPKNIQEIAKQCPRADIVFTNPNKSKIYIGSEFLEVFPSVKCICTASTGTVHIDMALMKKNNVHVICIKNERDVLEQITSTADLALTLSLMGIRQIIPAIEDVGLGGWDYEKFIGKQFNELEVGVIGLGRLGLMYSRYMATLGACVRYYDPFVENNDFIRVDDVNELFAVSNLVSIHIHATAKNFGFINESNLSARKQDLVLVNTSRGEVVDEEAIINRLKHDEKFIYATDVLIGEIHGVHKNPIFERRLDLKNLILTPHIGGMSSGAQFLAYNRAVDLLENFVGMSS